MMALPFVALRAWVAVEALPLLSPERIEIRLPALPEMRNGVVPVRVRVPPAKKRIVCAAVPVSLMLLAVMLLRIAISEVEEPRSNQMSL